MGEFLLVTIQVEMHDRLVMTLQDELTHSIVKHRARGVLHFDDGEMALAQRHAQRIGQ